MFKYDFFFQEYKLFNRHVNDHKRRGKIRIKRKGKYIVDSANDVSDEPMIETGADEDFPAVEVDSSNNIPGILYF